MADDRRVNMYFSEKKIIDDTIYNYFKDMPNRQDIIKMVLYNYVQSQNGNGIVINPLPNIHLSVTNNSSKSQNSDNLGLNITQNSNETQRGVNLVTKDSLNSNNELLTKKITALSNFL